MIFRLPAMLREAAGSLGPWHGTGLSTGAGHRCSGLLLAYRPFLEPAPIDRYWLWFLPPLILIVALVYRTIKSRSLAHLPRESAYLAFQISLFMVLAAAALWLLLLFV